MKWNKKKPASRSPMFREAGFATVELALSMPVVVFMLLSLSFVAVAGWNQLALTQAAATTARALALGESEQQARARGLQIAGDNAEIDFSLHPSTVEVCVSSAVLSPLKFLDFRPHSCLRIGREGAWDE